MLLSTNKERQLALDTIAELHVKLGSLPLNGPIDLYDVRNLHTYLEMLHLELAREIKKYSDSEE